jgi:hypothetical protein
VCEQHRSGGQKCCFQGEECGKHAEQNRIENGHFMLLLSIVRLLAAQQGHVISQVLTVIPMGKIANLLVNHFITRSQL